MLVSIFPDFALISDPEAMSTLSRPNKFFLNVSIFAKNCLVFMTGGHRESGSSLKPLQGWAEMETKISIKTLIVMGPWLVPGPRRVWPGSLMMFFSRTSFPCSCGTRRH